MTLDLSNAVANPILDTYDTHFPQNSHLEIRTGAPPGAENAASGTKLADITLPATPWNTAASGSKSKNGTWQDASADASGTAGHYRLIGTTTTKIEEGTVATSAADMIIDNTSINATQSVTVSTFTRTL